MGKRKFNKAVSDETRIDHPYNDYDRLNGLDKRFPDACLALIREIIKAGKNAKEPDRSAAVLSLSRIALNHPTLALPVVIECFKPEALLHFRDVADDMLKDILKIQPNETVSFLKRLFEKSNDSQKNFIYSILTKHCYDFLDEHEKNQINLEAELRH